MYISNAELALDIAKQVQNDQIKQVANARASQAAMVAQLGAAIRWLGMRLVSTGKTMQTQPMKLQGNVG